MTNNQTIIFIMTQQTNFSVGNLVQIIDPAEHPSEWATFVIRVNARKFSPQKG